MTSAPPSPELARFLREELGVDTAESDAGESDAGRAGWQVSGSVRVWRPAGTATGEAPAAWYFLPISGDVAEVIRAATRGRTGGFGSVRITATIGATSWQTSIFASKDIGGYLLPLKAAVRKAEHLMEGTAVEAVLLPA
jgi:hypothetical protein